MCLSLTFYAHIVFCGAIFYRKGKVFLARVIARFTGLLGADQLNE